MAIDLPYALVVYYICTPGYIFAFVHAYVLCLYSSVTPICFNQFQLSRRLVYLCFHLYGCLHGKRCPYIHTDIHTYINMLICFASRSVSVWLSTFTVNNSCFFVNTTRVYPLNQMKAYKLGYSYALLSFKHTISKQL